MNNKKYHVMIILMGTVINGVGWYLISTSRNNQTIRNILNDYKQNSTDKLICQTNVFYYDDAWENYDYFTNNDWKIINANTDIISPSLGYWVYISSYTTNNGNYIDEKFN